jgi:hypothetical protein
VICATIVAAAILVSGTNVWLVRRCSLPASSQTRRFIPR